MGQTALVDSQLDTVPRLIERLKAAQFPIRAAYWAQDGDTGKWFLYLVTDEVNRRGILKAYGTVGGELLKIPDVQIDPFDIKLVGPDDPAAKEVMKAHPGYSGRVRMRATHVTIGDAYFDGIMIY